MQKPQIPRSLEEYFQGSCHVYALALADYLSCPIGALWDVAPHERGEPLPHPVLVHAYAISPHGRLLDARGETTYEKIELEHGNVYEADYRTYTPMQFKEALQQSGISVATDELAQLQAFLQANKHQPTS